MLGRVVPFETLDEPARLGGGEGFVERGRLVGVEIVLHQHDLRRVGKMHVRQIPERMGIIDGGVVVGHFHKPPPFQRREHHEQIGDTIFVRIRNRDAPCVPASQGSERASR